MYKLIIFDLDGTLLDTSYDIRKTLNDTLKRFDCPSLTQEQTLSYIGNGARELCKRALPDDKQHLLEDFFKEYSTSSQNGDNALTKPFDGEEDALIKFKKKGIKLCILTNKPQIATERVVAQLLSFVEFDLIIGNSPKFALKPNAESTEYIINYFGVDKKDCLFVGDGETDVMTAKNAKIDGVAVLWGYRDEQTLRKYGANKFANNFSELEKIVYEK